MEGGGGRAGQQGLTGPPPPHLHRAPPCRGALGEGLGVPGALEVGF